MLSVSIDHYNFDYACILSVMLCYHCLRACFTFELVRESNTVPLRSVPSDSQLSLPFLSTLSSLPLCNTYNPKPGQRNSLDGFQGTPGAIVLQVCVRACVRVWCVCACACACACACVCVWCVCVHVEHACLLTLLEDFQAQSIINKPRT